MDESGKDESSKRRKVKYNLNYPVPEVRSNLEKDIKVMRAFVTASDFGNNLVGRAEVSPFTDINEQIVGGVLTFFSKIGLAEKDGTKYKPTQELIQFENELGYEPQEVAGKLLRPIILQTWFGEMATKIFRTENGTLSSDELFKRLGKMAGANPDYHKSAIKHLIGYLALSGIIGLDNDTERYMILSEVDEKSNPKTDESAYTTLVDIRESIAETSDVNVDGTSPVETTINTSGNSDSNDICNHSRTQVSLNINFQIDSSVEPSSVRAILREILEELKRQ